MPNKVLTLCQHKSLDFPGSETITLNYSKRNQPRIFPYAMIMEVGDQKCSIEIASHSNGIAYL